MKIGDIDQNLKVESKLNLTDVVWVDAKEAPVKVHGLAVCTKGDRFRRMPQEVADRVNDGVKYLNTNTAGGRIRFRTNSRYIAIRAVMPDNGTMPHITMTGQSGFDLYQSDAGDYRYAGSYIPGERSHGYESCRDTDRGMHTYTIHMPLYDPVEELYIGLAADAELDAPEPYRYEKPVLYYGSSITQGGCASRPGNAYQSMIARKLDCDFINLGFSGSARGESAIADYMASLDPSVFVCDYDHNAPNADHLEATHFPLYETFRRAHPMTPYIMVSKPDFHPGTEDERRRQIILDSYHKAIAAGDRRVRFVDGAHIFDGEFRDSCTVDGCHPNDLGFFRMAVVIGAAVEQALQEV
ncbi:MAG: SGNH/GDSL hydrolase family protein [Eubacteriales bacterium]